MKYLVLELKHERSIKRLYVLNYRKSIENKSKSDLLQELVDSLPKIDKNKLVFRLSRVYTDPTKFNSWYAFTDGEQKLIEDFINPDSTLVYVEVITRFKIINNRHGFGYQLLDRKNYKTVLYTANKNNVIDYRNIREKGLDHAYESNEKFEPRVLILRETKYYPDQYYILNHPMEVNQKIDKILREDRLEQINDLIKQIDPNNSIIKPSYTKDSIKDLPIEFRADATKKLEQYEKEVEENKTTSETLNLYNKWLNKEYESHKFMDHLNRNYELIDFDIRELN